LALSTAPSGDETSSAYPDVDFSPNPTPIRLSAQLGRWVDERAQSHEYAELSKRAAADAIAYWTARQAQQGQLFSAGYQAAETWSAARNAGAFSEIARVFFARFTERYLKYFLDREASAQLPSIADRDAFAASLSHFVDALGRHTFEATKISQSFAAGWYNKNAHSARPSEKDIEGFLRFALAKLRQELLREAGEK
jgi:hypothetical protein